MQNNNSAYRFLPYAALPSRALVWSIMTGVGITLPVLFLCSLITATPSEAHSAADTARRAAVLATAPWLLALKALLIAPILEEVFFRGLILQMLRRYLPLWVAVLVPTLIFALTHVGRNGMFTVAFAFLVGLYFSWLVVRGRSLLTSILCHSAINLTVNFVLNPIFIAHDIGSSAGWLDPLALVLLIGSLILFLAGVRVLHGEFSRRALSVAAA